MCSTPVSQHEAFTAGDQERRTDQLYAILVDRDNNLRTQLVKGLHGFITSKTKHAAVNDVFDNHSVSPLVQKSLILAAITREPDFLQHLMERHDTCNSSLSQYAVQILPPLLEQLLDGKLALDSFVLKATHEYILL